MYMHANKHTCLHHAHSQFGSIQVHPLLLAPCQSFHKLRQMQNKLSMQPVHSPLHQLHLLLHWAQHQMKIMKNWEMWWSKCVVQATMRKLWGSHHTKASARSSKQRIANWGKTGTRCSNNARIGKQNASVLQIQQCIARAPPKKTTKAPSTTKGPSRGTRSKLLLRESTSLQAQNPCNQKWQLVNHPNCVIKLQQDAKRRHQQRIHCRARAPAKDPPKPPPPPKPLPGHKIHMLRRPPQPYHWFGFFTCKREWVRRRRWCWGEDDEFRSLNLQCLLWLI